MLKRRHRPNHTSNKKNRDRDTQGLVHCAAITECNEPGVAQAGGIAQKMILI